MDVVIGWEDGLRVVVENKARATAIRDQELHLLDEAGTSLRGSEMPLGIMAVARRCAPRAVVSSCGARFER